MALFLRIVILDAERWKHRTWDWRAATEGFTDVLGRHEGDAAFIYTVGAQQGNHSG